MTSTALSPLPTLSSLTALPPALPPASSSRFSPPHGVALLASSPAPTRLLRLAALANCTALSQGLLLDLGVNPTFRQYISAASELLPRPPHLPSTAPPSQPLRRRWMRHSHCTAAPSCCLPSESMPSPLHGQTVRPTRANNLQFLDCSLTFLDVHRLCCRRRRRQPIIAIRLCSPSAP